MKLSKRSLILIIISMYTTVLVFANTTITSFLKIEYFNSYLLAIMPCTVIVSLLIDFLKKRKEIKLSRYNLITSIVFLILAIISIIIGIHISKFSIMALIHLGIILLLGITLYNIKINDEQFNTIKKHFFIVFGIVVLLGIIEYLFDFGLTNKIDSMKYIGIRGRVISTYHIATVLDKFLIIGLALLSYELLKEKNIYKIVLYLLGNITLALTFTRAGIIAFIALNIFFIIFVIIKKCYHNFIIILMSIIIMFLIPGYRFAFQSAADFVYQTLHVPPFLQVSVLTEKERNDNKIPVISDDESVIYRDYFESVGASVIKEYPVTGIGIGNYAYLYNNQNVNQFLEHKIKLPTPYMYPHNGFIQTMAEIGIVGFIGYLLFFTSFIVKKIKLNKLFILYPCFMLIFFFLLGTWTEGLFTTKQYMYIFMVIYPIYCNYQLKNKEI